MSPAQPETVSLADGAGDTANGTPLNAKENAIHEKRLVAVLKQLHDELDAAVLDAYGWHDQPNEQTILERLVALNTQRRAEEAQGHVRWLRPEFQAPQSAPGGKAEKKSGKGARLEFIRKRGQARIYSGRRNLSDAATSLPAPAQAPTQQTWPSTLPEQLAAVARILTDSSTAQTEAQLAASFTGKGRWKSRLPDIIKALEALGRARRLDDGRWLG